MSQRGSTRKRGDTWTAYWFVKAGDSRRAQRSKGGFRLKSEAQHHLTQVLAEVQAGTYSEPRKATLASFVTEVWLPARRSEGLRESTLCGYTTVMERWILPRIGGLALADITPRHVQCLYDDLAESGSTLGRGGLSKRSVQLAATLLRQTLTYAVEQGYLVRSPAAAIKRPKAPHSEMQAWTAGEAAAFLRSVADERLSALWLLALTRGPRRGELAGLRWADVDLEAGRISIRHTRVVVNAAATESTPKTDAGRRTVPLDDTLTAALRAHRRRQLEERLAWGPAWVDSGLVFTREDGSPLHPESLSTGFERLARRAGLRAIRFHDLRHTAATLALAAGIPTEYVAQWLGHSSASITRDLYQHVTPSMSEGAGAKLTALVTGGQL
ncbi:MAG TPA: tyrosine-type recombinase/integrase [Acidimicrobiales bacterium]|nr:tyrosine-type recombinase/integrase [Acidimicrobiales bacterium]